MATSILSSYPTTALADQLEQHNELVNRFITEMHADPLVADCAAHADFVAGTSSAFDHIEFPPTSFDSSHSEVTPWNDSFDQGKQRVKVDSIVTVEGLGIRPNGDPTALKFRCGYVSNQMLAFSWNDPVPAAAVAHGTRGRHGAGHKRGTRKATGHSSKRQSSRTAGKPGSNTTGKAATHKKH